MVNDSVNRWCIRFIFFVILFPISVGQAITTDSTSNGGMYEKYKGDQQKFLDDFAGARPNINKDELVPLIFSTLQRLTRYPLPDQYPTVTYLPSDELSKLACDSTCTVLGHYHGGLTVYLDDKLKPETNLFDRSVLLHEMVHYLQQLNLPESKSELSIHEKCVLWYTRERERMPFKKHF